MPITSRASSIDDRFFAPAKPAYIPSMAITWSQRLKRVFNIDMETCRECGWQWMAI